MPREGVDLKGRRYLSEGRLLVKAVSADHIYAVCRGDGDIYHLTGDRHGWSCSCPAVGRCCHLIALRLVTVRPFDVIGPGPRESA